MVRHLLTQQCLVLMSGALWPRSMITGSRETIIVHRSARMHAPRMVLAMSTVTGTYGNENKTYSDGFSGSSVVGRTRHGHRPGYRHE